MRREQLKGISMTRLLMVLLCLFPWIAHARSIALVTASIGSEYYRVTLPGTLSKEAYCKKHGYDFICIKEALDPTRPLPWQKILAIKDVLSKYDWVFWADADAIIMNKDVTLESFIDAHENASFILTYDYYSNCVNTGHFLLKNCEWSFAFLDEVYSRTEFINHSYWEQGAVIQILKEAKNTEPYVKVLHQRTMNSFPPEASGHTEDSRYQSGDFIVHFAGVRSLSFLDTLMRKYSALQQ
jgi:hypothetical protein